MLTKKTNYQKVVCQCTFTLVTRLPYVFTVCLSPPLWKERYYSVLELLGHDKEMAQLSIFMAFETAFILSPLYILIQMLSILILILFLSTPNLLSLKIWRTPHTLWELITKQWDQNKSICRCSEHKEQWVEFSRHLNLSLGMSNRCTDQHISSSFASTLESILGKCNFQKVAKNCWAYETNI